MNQLVQELTGIVSTIDNDSWVDDNRKQEALDYVTKCLDPNAPTHEVSLLGLVRDTFFLYRFVPEEHKERYKEIIDEVEKVLIERGYREDFNTWQEHTLLGSTVWQEYAKKPHQPIGVIKGDLSVSEAQRARELAGRYRAFGSYFNLNDSLVHISLEPLDGNGNTVRDPQVLDDGLNPVATTYSADFPARRE